MQGASALLVRQSVRRCRSLQSEVVRPAEIARKLGIGRASVYRVLGEREKVAA
jgi:DNA invertase Pin-like site-specific DNA recombinase